jgi:hypothetical protein
MERSTSRHCEIATQPYEKKILGVLVGGIRYSVSLSSSNENHLPTAAVKLMTDDSALNEITVNFPHKQIGRLEKNKRITRAAGHKYKLLLLVVCINLVNIAAH